MADWLAQPVATPEVAGSNPGLSMGFLCMCPFINFITSLLILIVAIRQTWQKRNANKKIRNTVEERIYDLVNEQLKAKIVRVVAFSLTICEITDVC